MSREADRFAVCTMKRVFDTEPVQDVVTLAQLCRGLSRFAVKDKLQRRITRETARAEKAWEQWRAGERAGGRQLSYLVRAHRKAQRQGLDADAEVEAAHAHLRRLIKGQAKTDLRIWIPALFRPLGRRKSVNVIHVSCLVLDYDTGYPIDFASEDWGAYFHIIHSTWSYQPTDPRFRLFLPLAQPVKGEDWEKVWAWAEQRSGGQIDPQPKSPAANYALPAVPSEDAPSVSITRRGPLLDLAASGLPIAPAEPPDPDIIGPSESAFRDGDPKTIYLEPVEGDDDDDDWDVEGSFDLF